LVTANRAQLQAYTWNSSVNSRRNEGKEGYLYYEKLHIVLLNYCRFVYLMTVLGKQRGSQVLSGLHK